MIDVLFRRLRVSRSASVEFIALGTYCQSAAALRDAGLRNWSGPFDWIHSTPSMIADCIDDDFAALLDTDEMMSVPQAELPVGSRRQCRHLSMEPRYGLPPLFNHHDPAGHRPDFLALTRSVDRFRRALGAAHDKLFVMLTMFERTDDDVDRLHSTLLSRSSSNRLLVVTTRMDDTRTWSEVRRRDSLLQADLSVTSASTGVLFENADDNRFLRSVLLSLSRADPICRGSRISGAR